jgi:hypothetical protein
MTRPAAFSLVIALAFVFGWGVLAVFDARFETGGIYPAYSSLRKDPDGTSAIFQSLQRLLPATERGYVPLEAAPWSDRTILLLGTRPDQLGPGAPLNLRLVESLARRRNRVIIALRPELQAGPDVVREIETTWGVKIEDAGAREAPDIHFRINPNWTVVRGDIEHADVVERPFGPGSVVLLTSSALFTNSALTESPDAGLFVSILGAGTGIVFDEAHLGIVESGSVMGLLRAFQLQGLLLGLLFLIALFVWKYSTSFPPAPRSRPAPLLEGRRSFSGLVALLRRNLGAADLASACWREWLKGAPRALPAEVRARVELQLVETAAQPLETLRRMHEILNRKRTD